LETSLNCLDWIEQVESMGCGEILLTSMDGDGTKEGYDLELLMEASKRTSVPIIASGGAGSAEHITQALESGAQAALAASIFHYGILRIKEVKEHLLGRGIPVRIGE
ncbi:MAG: imidazole glycerol phosphate synthase subunit HisF, partial [Synergistales bacterium]|nr:imidazole glycerol phosphate synthase subunit HisF [Synergistales bacterium]